ncbi:rod shape-determining protein MreC [Candidatus Roseilinea sp. NK_OTU-006]|uniref:rod shape-determining protein MreC n=1 Tax=Candidatus Roseilinea sp. NK_OTU-006 TaxID=2704250 RepID=UPI00145CEEBC|nr:rod shape-determining protein MreC [Candidatus Roseilinea sp. NK_OTU-006]
MILLLLGFLAQTPIAQGPLSVVIGPIQQVMSNARRVINDFFRSTGELIDLRARAEALQREVTALRAENVRLREFQAEVQQYRDLLNFANDNPAYELVGADVIGIADAIRCKGKAPTMPDAGKCANVIAGDVSPFVRYITIDVGERDGIQVGMPVVAGGLALVGRVGEVSYATSQVQLLTDPASFINVRLIESRASGTVAGTSEGILLLQNVPQGEALKPGDLIVTSGLGGTLPQALPVGVVERVISQDVETTRQAIVRPGVDFDKLEVVLVITRPLASQARPPTPTP